MTTFPLPFVPGACALLLASVATGCARRVVPNVLPAALAALFVAAWAWTGFPPGVVLRPGIAAAFLLLLAGFLFGHCGDVKRAPAVMLWVEPGQWTAYCPGFVSVSGLMILWAMLPLPSSRRHRRRLPFTAALALPAVGTLVAPPLRAL